MASVKLKFRSSRTTSRSEGTLYYQILHERRVSKLDTSFRIMASEWDQVQERIKMASEGGRRSYLRSIKEQVILEIERLMKIIRRFDERGIPYCSEDVVEEYQHQMSTYSLFSYMESLMTDFRNARRDRATETYQSAKNSFGKYLKEGRTDPRADIMIDSIDNKEMEAYERWLRQRDVVPNTVSFYLRILRAVYNRAVEDGITENRYPFRNVYTGIDKTVKRALPLAMIKKIKALDLASDPNLDFARDIFMLSFMLRGMSFVDMTFLRKSDLVDGYVVYRRRKTGQLLMIKWTGDMQKIVGKYPENSSQYLLPIISSEAIPVRSMYRKVGYRINYNLKRLASKLGLTVPLTLYVARHSWASAAKKKGVPISVISESMGHTSETTTRIYLSSLDTSVIDRANSMILASL